MANLAAFVRRVSAAQCIALHCIAVKHNGKNDDDDDDWPSRRLLQLSLADYATKLKLERFTIAIIIKFPSARSESPRSMRAMGKLGGCKARKLAAAYTVALATLQLTLKVSLQLLRTTTSKCNCICNIKPH